MNLLNPLALAFGLLAVPILLLYMLKLRRRDATVSSTLLWDMLVRDRQANRPWQRIKRNLLLFLQLLILALLTLALARPAIPVSGVSAPVVVLLLDGSASMLAQDGAPDQERTRFEAARERAREIISSLPPDSQAFIILAGIPARSLASAESRKADLLQALEQAEPALGEADWDTAFALAAGAARSSGGEDAIILLLSDGGLPEQEFPPMPGRVRFTMVGSSAENLAISAFALRPSNAGSGVQLLARVNNYGLSSQRSLLSLYANEVLFHAESLVLPPGDSHTVVIEDLTDEPAVYEARLSPVQGEQFADALPVDNRAFAVYNPPSEERAVLLPSLLEPEVRYNRFLQQAMVSVLGEEASFQLRPDAEGELVLPQELFGMYVFDSLLSRELPEQGGLLLVNPPSNALFSVGEPFMVTAPVEVADHTLTAFLEWDGVHIRQARSVTLPPWATPLIWTEEGPLVFAGETGGRRVAVLTFDLRDSDLPLQVAFPILLSNLSAYLLQSQPIAFDFQPRGLSAGESINIPPPYSGETVEVISPSGRSTVLDAGVEGILYRGTDELGVYTIRYPQETGIADEHFAVNLFSPQESHIQPSAGIDMPGETANEGAEQGVREFWPWLAALGLIFFLLEWYIYHNQRVPPGGWQRRLASLFKNYSRGEERNNA